MSSAPVQEGPTRARRLASIAGNMLLASFFGFFAFAHLQSFFVHFRPSALLIVVKELLDAGFYLTRRSPSDFSVSPYAWATGLTGTMCPLLLRPTATDHDLWLGQLLLYSGLALQSFGMLSLNRSIGIVPANRGVVTSGLYRLVRNPLYSAYTLTQAGYLIANFCPYNASVVTASVLLQVLRIYNEERFLVADPRYVAFMKRTRWRMVPYLF